MGPLFLNFVREHSAVSSFITFSQITLTINNLHESIFADYQLFVLFCRKGTRYEQIILNEILIPLLRQARASEADLFKRMYADHFRLTF